MADGGEVVGQARRRGESRESTIDGYLSSDGW